MNVLVTGGAGYIGSKVVLDLEKKKYKVVIIDDLSTGCKSLISKKSIFYKANIQDENAIEKIFKKYKFKAVFHFAASLSVPESQSKPLKYYLNNVIGTENILKQISKTKVKYFIFSSTCAVYGEVNGGRVSEKSPLMPESNYGKTKLLAEQLTKSFSSKYPLKYAILRYFNVVGADPNLKTGPIKEGSLFKNITSGLKHRIPQINLYGTDYKTLDGTAVRDYIDVNDLSSLHLESFEKLKKSNSFILNCGYGKPLSVKKVVNSFQKIANKKIKIKNKPRRLGDVEKVYADIKLLKKKFPKWRSQYSLSDSIKFSLEWEKKINGKN